MGTTAKIVLGLLIIMAITAILVSPDPTDDVMVVVHQQHVVTVQPVVLSLPPVSILVDAVPVAVDFAVFAVSADLIDLVCTRLC